MLGFAFHFDEGEELEQEVLAGLLKRGDGAFKPLEEADADEADNAALPALFKILHGLRVSFEIGQRIVGREGEERLLLGEGDLQFPQQMAVGFLDGVGDDLRRLLHREKSLGRA